MLGGAAVVNVADSDASTTQGRYMDTFIIEKYPPSERMLILSHPYVRQGV